GSPRSRAGSPGPPAAPDPPPPRPPITKAGTAGRNAFVMSGLNVLVTPGMGRGVPPPGLAVLVGCCRSRHAGGGGTRGGVCGPSGPAPTAGPHAEHHRARADRDSGDDRAHAAHRSLAPNGT